ncbi:MAG: hypothetical protein JXX28_02860, partial [Deltaproteobacteria bacterium]|nr:hypothetical protein [Deltaproteobacteria bacterium]
MPLGITIGAPMTRIALVALLALSACKQEQDPDFTPRAVNERTAALAGVVDGNNAFALDLFAAVNDRPDENLFISPFSVSSALAMTYAGARTETAAQMESVLHITSPAEVYHAQFGALTRDLDGDLGR